MTDYARLIDKETWDFIRETESWYPPVAVSRTVAEQRDVYNKLCRAFFRGYPDGVKATDLTADGVPVREYICADRNDAAVVFYLHGGGFVVGGLESHDDICAEICAATGFTVVSADYRLAPEHVHPASYDDAVKAFDWVKSRHDRPVVLVGDSAGGNLCAAVSHTRRGDKIAGQVLIYPVLEHRDSGGSRDIHADAPMLTTADMTYYEAVRTGGVIPSDDPRYMPMQDSHFDGLPPTVAVSAECDPLCDDAERYCALLNDAGGRALCLREAGLVHGYLRARRTVARAQVSFDRILKSVALLGAGQMPTSDDLDS